MDKFKTDFLGRMPIFLNDFRFMDGIYRNAFASVMKTLGADNIILYGCGLTNNGNGTYTVAAGAVVVNSEIHLCLAHTFACTNINEAYFVVTETFDPEGNRLYGDNVSRDTYLLRRVVASQHNPQPVNSISANASRFSAIYIKEGDARLTNSRQSNNNFDSAAIARTNLDVFSKGETGTQISTAINALINGSPGALDTLKELADAMGDDANFAATVTNALANKVDKIAGMGLSANDFTTILLNKLNGIAAGANNYTHPATHLASMIEQDSTHRFVVDSSAWTAPSLSANYVDYGTGLRYRKDANGQLQLFGSIQKNTGAGYVLFTLPVDFRPLHALNIPVAGALSSVALISVDGTVFIGTSNLGEVHFACTIPLDL
jgi:hypothetical protein